MRTDLDGDGTDEVLIVAEHAEADTSLPPRAAWYNLVLVRVVDGDGVRTHVLAEDVYTQDDPESYPTFGRYRISAIADLNGDGRSEDRGRRLLLRERRHAGVRTPRARAQPAARARRCLRGLSRPQGGIDPGKSRTGI